MSSAAAAAAGGVCVRVCVHEGTAWHHITVATGTAVAVAAKWLSIAVARWHLVVRLGFVVGVRAVTEAAPAATPPRRGTPLTAGVATAATATAAPLALAAGDTTAVSVEVGVGVAVGVVVGRQARTHVHVATADHTPTPTPAAAASAPHHHAGVTVTRRIPGSLDAAASAGGGLRVGGAWPPWLPTA